MLPIRMHSNSSRVTRPPQTTNAEYAAHFYQQWGQRVQGPDSRCESIMPFKKMHEMRRFTDSESPRL